MSGGVVKGRFALKPLRYMAYLTILRVSDYVQLGFAVRLSETPGARCVFTLAFLGEGRKDTPSSCENLLREKLSSGGNNVESTYLGRTSSLLGEGKTLPGGQLERSNDEPVGALKASATFIHRKVCHQL